jgi:hypothetical protein
MAFGSPRKQHIWVVEGYAFSGPFLFWRMAMAKFKTKAEATKCAKSDVPAKLSLAEAHKVFLSRLAETANVSESARTAGINSFDVYAQRSKSAAFRVRWEASLAVGYARLEAELLAEALRGSSPNVSDTTLKSRAQKQKLGLALLAAHKATVRGVKDLPPPRTGSKSQAEAIALVKSKLDIIRGRLIEAGVKP